MKANRQLRRCAALLLPITWLAALALAAQPPEDVADVVVQSVRQFEAEVDRRLEVPREAQATVIASTDAALDRAGVGDLSAQHVLVVDRSPQVQAIFVLLHTPSGDWRWIGASPVSTGRVGSFEYFRTPLGVFRHTPANPDFRAEGTVNANGIRGYGVRGMRVFDFGWVVAERGWGSGGFSPMRLQMHATDPDWLEPRLGRVASKGCIRIPATLNVWLDRRAIIDADYNQALAAGAPMWVLRADRKPTPWPGRYLVVIDSGTRVRPHWAPRPGSARAASTAAPEAGC
jgi:hypothetical protein